MHRFYLPTYDRAGEDHKLGKVIWEIEIEFPIRLYKKGQKAYAVQYGKQVHADLSYTEAATQLGASIMHARALSGEMG